MDTTFTLISLQPLMKSQDPFVQWSYYEDLVKDHLKTLTSTTDYTFICLPEYALGNKTTYSEGKLLKIKEKISSLAKETNSFIIAGSFAHYEDSKWFNRSLVFNPKGKNQFHYDKAHPFNFELKNGITPGTNKEVFKIGDLHVKLLICSDLWFPEEIRNLSNNRLDLILVPAMAVVKSARLIHYGKKLWHSLALTRSKENVIPLVVSDWAAQQMRESYTCGSSCIINPSIRWTNESEEQQAYKKISNSSEGIISSVISKQAILEYQAYRREVGLLPELD